MGKMKKISEKKLRLEYIKKDKTAYQIAKEHKIHVTSVKYQLKKYNIKKCSLNRIIYKVPNKLVKKWIKLFNDGNTIYSIHKQNMEYSYDTIRNYLVRNNMNVNLHSRNNTRYEEFVNEWIVLANAGNSVEEISKKYNCTPLVVRRKLLKNNITLIDFREINKIKVAKIINDNKEIIIKCKKEGYTLTEISKKTEIPVYHISDFLRSENLHNRIPIFLRHKSEIEQNIIKNDIIAKFNEGKSMHFIALKYNTNTYLIKVILKEKFPDLNYFKNKKIHMKKNIKLNRYINYLIDDVIIYDKSLNAFTLNPKYNLL